MVRIVGGIILMRIGFSLFMPSAATTSIADSPSNCRGGQHPHPFPPPARALDGEGREGVKLHARGGVVKRTSLRV